MDAKVIREQTVRDAKSNLILDSARKVFSEKGFHETRLEDIAAAAGFSKASLYNYYEDKEQIFLSLAVRDIESLFMVLNTQLTDNLPFLEGLTTAIRTILSFYGEHFAFMFEMAKYQSTPEHGSSGLHDHHLVLSKRFKEESSKILETYAKLIKSAKKNGEISSLLDERLIAEYIGSLVRGIIFSWKTSGKPDSLDREVEQLISFVSHGLLDRQ